MGIFEPVEAYSAERHAHESGAGANAAEPSAMARFIAGEDTLDLTFFLMDYTDVLTDEDARQLHVFFPDWQTYEGFFDT